MLGKDKKKDLNNNQSSFVKASIYKMMNINAFIMNMIIKYNKENKSLLSDVQLKKIFEKLE